MTTIRKYLLWLASAAIVVAPASAQQRQLRSLSPRDVAEAKREHAAMVREMGGAETGPRAIYVETVGRRVSAFSGVANPRQSLHFTTLNSAVENAFSVPGGYVYVTRQLMALMDDEAELAFALGHEVGHVAANHAHIREAYEQRNPMSVFGRIVGAVMGPSMMSSILSTRAKLDTLSFSRDQEYQADMLGIRYMIAAGYDPSGSAEMLAALSRNSALQARLQGRNNRQTPEWALTHPLSQNRMQRALQVAQASGRMGTGIRNRDGFLREIDGMLVDDDPAQGIIDGVTFTHPDLRIQFSVPPGYLMSNGADAVTISGSAGKAQFGGGRYEGTLDQYIVAVFRQLTRGQRQLSVPRPQLLTINGMPAAVTTARLATRNGVIDVSAVAYKWDNQHAYHFVMLTRGGSGVGPFASMIGSLRRISVAEAAEIRPRVIDVVIARPGDTVQSMAARMAYRNFRLERFLALNGLSANSPLAPGQKVKLIVLGTRRA